MPVAYLLTGSNIGNSAANLENASAHIQRRIGRIEKASPVYSTEPWGNKHQEAFLNQVLEVRTTLSPAEVMKAILEIEHEMGRNRQIKWEPRIIDVDILFYDQLVLHEDHLTIPHPLLHERRFTLIPMNEIAPEFEHPVFHKTISQLLKECSDNGKVEKL